MTNFKEPRTLMRCLVETWVIARVFVKEPHKYPLKKNTILAPLSIPSIYIYVETPGSL
jgi:hypothetical protein